MKNTAAIKNVPDLTPNVSISENCGVHAAPLDWRSLPPPVPPSHADERVDGGSSSLLNARQDPGDAAPSILFDPEESPSQRWAVVLAAGPGVVKVRTLSEAEYEVRRRRAGV